MRHSARIAVLLFLSACAMPAFAGKVGPQFRVNSSPEWDQYSPWVAAVRDGFVVVWQSNPGGDEYNIFGRRYNTAGKPAGAEFGVSEQEPKLVYKRTSAIAGLTTGGFVVVWEDSSATDVFARRFSAAGTPLGGTFLPSTFVGRQGAPAVAGLLNGAFVVVWHSRAQDGAYYGIYGQRFSGNGTRNGAEFRVNSFTANEQRFPAIAGLANGGFVVVYQSAGRGTAYDIYGQRYRANGTRKGAEFRVNSFKAEGQFHPSIATLADGGFVVTWQSRSRTFPAAFESGIYGQRFHADGTRAGAEFQVNTHPMADETFNIDDPTSPSVSALGAAGFVVVWQSYTPELGVDIFGQRFAGNGTRIGKEFRVNTAAKSDQRWPSVAGFDEDGFVAVWQSPDSGSQGIWGQLFNAD